MISVHSPEYESHKLRATVEASRDRHKLDQPIYMDNDFAFWNGLGNRYWPSFHLVDRAGRVRLSAVGEMHENTARADSFETALKALLDEPPPRSS
ncbi:MAG: hypothetical protein HY342_00415 [Candidatus Lambdaproteobacteria bacterium]|nr:hypothetical protein [Candidatus Lambdaproteobacteria bacterium]